MDSSQKDNHKHGRTGIAQPRTLFPDDLVSYG